MKQRRRYRYLTSRGVEQLETRHLLAGDLISHWRADDLAGTHADGDTIPVWLDSVGSIPAQSQGTPHLSASGIGGRATVRFDQLDGTDAFRVDQTVSPMRNANDFTVVVAFASSEEMTGDNGQWFENTGLVDGSNLGFTRDWGLSVNRAGQVSGGIGAGLLKPPRTVYSSATDLNDGQLHVVFLTRDDAVLTVHVDNLPSDSRNDADDGPRFAELDMTFGVLETGDNPFAGEIAEIRIYDGALSAGEIAAAHSEVVSYYTNQPPVPQADQYRTAEDAPLFFVSAEVGVLANDTDAEGDSLRASLVDDVEHGALTLNADGSFLYIPETDFFGIDRFTYTANDHQPSGLQTVTLVVEPAYDPAVPQADHYDLLPTETLIRDASRGVLANDLNPDRADLKAVLELDVSTGELSLAPDGSFAYNPLGVAGSYSFSYRIDDGQTLSAPVTVTLNVNTPPRASFDQYATDEDAILVRDAVAGVLSNDVDADGDPLLAEIVATTVNGELELQPSGAFVYGPARHFVGRDTFSYRISDGQVWSETVLVNLEIRAINDPPDAQQDEYFTLIDNRLEVSADRGLLANDSDVDSPQLSVRLVTNAAHGQLQLSPDGSFLYDPSVGFEGSDEFTYVTTDGESESAAATVRLNVSTVQQLRQVVINEIHYDPDESGEPLEFIELYNASPFTVDISNWRFVNGIDFVIPPDQQIAAGGFQLLAEDPQRLEAEFAVSSLGPWTGRLSNDGETIRLRSDTGALIDEVDYKLGYPWPTVGDTPGRSIQLVSATSENDVGGNWRSSLPTPGETNSVLLDNVPPLTRQVNHQPESPLSGQDVTVTVKVTDSDGVQAVSLDYQVVEAGSYIRLSDDEYETSWQTVEMNDDGQSGDAVAGDDVYTVVLPGQSHRTLVRYRMTATDQAGSAVSVPYDDDPQPNFAYFVYDGIPEWVGADRPGTTEPVTYNKEVMNSLPAYHLIAQERDVERSQYSSSFNTRRFQGTLVHRGVVYDHIEFRNRGQFSTYVSGKNKWKLVLNRGHEFQAYDDYGQPWGTKLRKMNLGTAASPWARPNRGLAGMDEALAFKFFNLAGVAAPRISPIQLRVIDDAEEASATGQYEGDLWGLYLAFEDPGGRFLSEHDLPDGNLFRMAAASTEIKHQGINLPGNLSDVRAFTSSRTGYNLRGLQPVPWWRENVDLDTYYSYRAVIEAINHSDLRDQQNSLLYFNADTGKWTQLPWDLDLLYEEFDRWGPDGVQDRSILEQFRKALGHEEINIEFQARLREMQDLFFNTDQAWQAVEEYARYVERFAAVDRAMWDYHPRTSSIHRGFFYRSPAPYHGGANGLVRRPLTSDDFEGMVNWVKEFIVDGGFGGSQLKLLHQDADIPTTPAIQYVGEMGFPADGLRFQTTPFSDPQGLATFQALEWRIGEVTDPQAPGFDSNQPVHYEVTAVWESGKIGEFADVLEVDASALQAGHAYRARVRMQDDTGRWSHWSDPVQFVATAGNSDLAESLRISEVHYHPADPSAVEAAAGFGGDDFEFIELVNVGGQTLDLAGAQLIATLVDGSEEGVTFDFAGGDVARLQPGERVVVVEDLEAFELRYGSGLPVAGQWSGRLSNSGETITLAAFGEPFLQFRYDDRWHRPTDGDGPSLEFGDVSQADLTAWSRGENWQPSQRVHGTPGTAATQSGDANRDGVFDSTDFVQVFQAGEYEDDVEDNSTWEEGDWDSDQDFTTSDLVLAFQSGGYVAARPRPLSPLAPPASNQPASARAPRVPARVASNRERVMNRPAGMGTARDVDNAFAEYHEVFGRQLFGRQLFGRSLLDD